jgi:hypothetical protein
MLIFVEMVPFIEVMPALNERRLVIQAALLLEKRSLVQCSSERVVLFRFRNN